MASESTSATASASHLTLTLIDEHFDDGLRAAYFSPHEEYAIQVAKDKAKTSLEAVEDSTSVLDLRDWMCSQWSQCSIRSQPPTKSDVRMFMDGLRAQAAEHRAEWALQQVVPLMASSLLQDTEFMHLYACRAAEELPRAPELHLRKAAEELSKALKMRPLSLLQLQSFARELGIPDAQAVRLVLDVVKTPESWYTLYVNADRKGTDGISAARHEKREKRQSFWGGICLPKDLVCSAASVEKSLDSAAPSSFNTPALSELHLILEDGTITGMSGRAAMAPAACTKLGATVVAACSVPMSSFVVAILSTAATRSDKLRTIVLWDAHDNQSFAVLHESLEAWDALDVQLNGEGDMLVQVCTRGTQGRAIMAPRTLCLRMRGRDVSTVHHAPMDVARSERILAQRLENGKINHMDHGNIVTWKVNPFDVSDGHGLTEMWYGDVRVGSLSQETVTCWGNPFRVYAWSATGQVWVGTRLNREPMTFVEETSPLHKANANVVCATHLTEA